jgi:hypothetical protein
MTTERLESGLEDLNARLIHLETMTCFVGFTAPEREGITSNLQSIREFPEPSRSSGAAITLRLDSTLGEI